MADKGGVVVLQDLSSSKNHGFGSLSIPSYREDVVGIFLADGVSNRYAVLST